MAGPQAHPPKTPCARINLDIGRPRKGMEDYFEQEFADELDMLNGKCEMYEWRYIDSYPVHILRA